MKNSLVKQAATKVAEAVRSGAAEPLGMLTQPELAALARQASQAASDSRRAAHRERDVALRQIAKRVGEVLAGDVKLARALSGGTLAIRLAHDAEPKATWRANRAARRVVPETQRAFAAWAHEYVAAHDIKRTLELVETHVAPWPGNDLQAKRNSVKAAVHRLRQADHAVLKITTPEAAKTWGKKHKQPKVGAAMAALLREDS